jgi:uncharacterized protein
MRFLILDTNIIVSAAIKPDSKPARIVLDWVLRGPVQIATCPSVAAEYRTVSAYPKFAGYGFPPQWLERLIQEGLQLPEPEQWTQPLPDATDGPFLALAHAAGAWLVTGNLKHFPEAARNGVTVVSPAEYLDRLG